MSKATSKKINLSQANMALAVLFLPEHRKLNKRSKHNTLDWLIDERRKIADIENDCLDYIYMSYRYLHFFELELAAYQSKKLRPSKLADYLLLGFAALLSRDRQEPQKIINRLCNLIKEQINPGAAKFCYAFLKHCLREKETLISKASNKPEIFLGPKLLAEHKELDSSVLAMLCESIPKRGEGISYFNEKAELLHSPAKEFFENADWKQAINPASWQCVAFLFDKIKAAKNFSVLDACAAPGGKSLALASMLKKNNISATIYATDNKAPRLKRLKENYSQSPFPSTQAENVLCFDWNNIKQETWPQNWPESFDLILADLPCSGTGTLNSQPDILLEDIALRVQQLLPIQNNILKNLKAVLKSDGQLYTSICSLHPQENLNIFEQSKSSKLHFKSEDVLEQNNEFIRAWLS